MKPYPGSTHIGNLPELPLKVGDTWDEVDPDGDRIFSWRFHQANHARIDAYHEPVARELGKIDTSARGA